ncbi:OB-fold nucleic acid binding domain-containing protein [Thalassobacter stenotrophicus]|uniref:OB-fold nucleic acid binding domain-containing protein n=1 Tax=Thalassobacter stenotrophicus TaxID=266809 RepID=UPI0022A9152C|nr:OB-fold nucleic acid binding domain-containing protein [Thalassobacter stenotrophicus]UYP66863.1 OB-fold nucleic acid binding domain-containing protein [Thalassobacter stenotrophicus]
MSSHCTTTAALNAAPNTTRLTVAGLVLVRQRPGTAKGVIFLTLEDETGTCNVIVWKSVYEQFRRAIIAGRLLRVTGRVQRQGPVTHVVAETVDDISPMLDALLSPDLPRAHGQLGPSPSPSLSHAPKPR